MKYDFLILSSLSRNSGCFLRAGYLSAALQKAGAGVKLILPCRSKPLMFDFVINFFRYLTAVLIYDFKTGVAIKPYPNALFPLLLKRALKRCRIVVDIDDIDFGYRKGIISFISRWIQKPFPRYFDMVTYHNELLRLFILNEYKADEKKLYVLKQGVDFNVFNYKINTGKFKNEFFARHHLKENTKIMIYTGHLNIASDLELILNNIKSVMERNNCFLIIAGGGPLFSYYKGLAEKLKLPHLYFTGWLPPEEIVKYILISDISLVYYKDKKVNYFRSSMKLREQLALKKKIVCNDVGELKLFSPFTFQSNKDIKDFMALLDKILKMTLKDKREIKGYEFIKKNYNWDTIGRDFLRKNSA